MSILHLSKENFDDIVQNNELVVVDFWAKWCGPCLAFAKIFDALSETMPDIIFAKVNVEEQPQLAEDFQVRAIPHLIIFKREFALFSESGIQSKSALCDLIEQAKKINLQSLRENLLKNRD